MNTANTTSNTNNIHAMPRPVRIVDRYSYNELYKAAHEMSKSGGHFAAALAEAFFVADSTNKAILLDAFGHLFAKFVPTEEEVK